MTRSFKNKVLIKIHTLNNEHFFFIVWCRYGYGIFVIERPHQKLKLYIGFIQLSYLNAIKFPKKKCRYY